MTNAAVSGTGVKQTLSTAAGIDKKYNAVILAIGVNDARRKAPPYKSAGSWAKKFNALVVEAKRLSDNVYLSTILPTEAEKRPLGNYAVAARIRDMNHMMAHISKRNKVTVIDANRYFVKKMARFTLDGVHPTSAGSIALVTFWSMNVKQCH